MKNLVKLAKIDVEMDCKMISLANAMTNVMTLVIVVLIMTTFALEVMEGKKTLLFIEKIRVRVF